MYINEKCATGGKSIDTYDKVYRFKSCEILNIISLSVSKSEKHYFTTQILLFYFPRVLLLLFLIFLCPTFIVGGSSVTTPLCY